MIIRERTDSFVTIDTPAKINLFLQVLGKRSDGYHDIYSLFQAVDLYDTLRVTLRKDDQTTLAVENAPSLESDERNLVLRSFRLLQHNFHLPSGIDITLTKRIPLGAGLGGGSSDAAAMIRACNILYDLKLSVQSMAEIGVQTGSDVPFFFGSGQAIVTGRGEKIENIVAPTDYQLLLINPGFPVSTASAYASLNIGLTLAPQRFSLDSCHTIEDFVATLKLIGNDFEPVQRSTHPELDLIASELEKSCALLVRMSGSGPTMYGLFDESRVLRRQDLACDDRWSVFAVRPVRFTTGG